MFALAFAILHFKQGRYQDALEPLRNLLNVEPTNVFANHALGMVCIGLGNREAAMQQYHILKNLNQDAANDLLQRINN